MSDHSPATMIEGLKQAISAEGDGHHFYLMAASSTQDQQGKAVLQTLAAEELDHIRFLKGQYRALLETGQPDRALQLGPRAELSGASPIFSPELRGRVGEAHFEMTALSIGIQLEQSAVQFYRAQAEAATDATVRAFYEELVAWETGHHQALLRQQDALRDDYWSAGGFSPF
jgi:rubrerythrin